MQNIERRIAELEKQASTKAIEFKLIAPWLNLTNLIRRNSLERHNAIN
jgi:hypothetical protein